jgi:hypothetical protein
MHTAIRNSLSLFNFIVEEEISLFSLSPDSTHINRQLWIFHNMGLCDLFWTYIIVGIYMELN